MKWQKILWILLPDLPISFPPIVSTTPPLYGSGLGVNTGTIAVFDSTNGKVHITSEFQAILLGLDPAFTGYALGLTGTLSGFVVRADMRPHTLKFKV